VKWKSGAMTIIWARRTPAMFTAGNDISAATSYNFDKSTPPLDLELNKRGADPCFSIEDFFKGERLCQYCGINIDIPYKDILFEIHSQCWKQYRLDNKTYPMPSYAGAFPDEEQSIPFVINY
jgi:hypothetical protein